MYLQKFTTVSFNYVLLIFPIDKVVDCSLEDVMTFFSGAESIPPCGFEGLAPSLVFLHGNQPLPTASTCDLEFRLPTRHENFEKFKDAMILGIKGHDGFGEV